MLTLKRTSQAFYACSSLASVTIPDSVTSIGSQAFYACTSLASVTIPNSVTTIGDAAFENCTSLTIVTIGNSVTSIGNQAFSGCTSLASVTIPDSVTDIGDGAFRDCTSLAAITVDADNRVFSSLDGVLFDKSLTVLVQYPEGKTGNYTIPDIVTSIGNYAFYGCTSLTSVTIPNNVISIEDGAFRECTSLTSVTIGNSVTYIGVYAFIGCTSLMAITVDADNRVFSSLDGVLFDKSLTALIQCPGGKAGNYTIPSSVTSIGNYAFYGCLRLTAITVDADNSTYGSVDGVLFDKSLTVLIRYPGGKTGNYMIPNSVTRIGQWVFYGCTSLTSVTIGNGVTSIGNYAFYGCTSLTSVYFNGDAPRVGENVFFSADKVTVYYLPGTTGWGSTFADRPTALWSLPNPVILNKGPSFGVQANVFGFIISWASGTTVVVEACTTLVNPIWSSVGTATLTGGTSYFSDPEWANYPTRFYRLRAP